MDKKGEEGGMKGRMGGGMGREGMGRGLGYHTMGMSMRGGGEKRGEEERRVGSR
jgi:hypothetical protein